MLLSSLALPSPGPSPSLYFPPITQSTDALTSLYILRQIPPLPTRTPPRDMQLLHSRDPHLAQAIDRWMKGSRRALASVRVVDLRKLYEPKEEEKSKKPVPHPPPSVEEMCRAGEKLRTRALEALSPRHRDDGNMGQFIPTHITKV